MTGEILKDKKYGGLKALDEHADETQKLQNAKADSVERRRSPDASPRRLRRAR